MAVLSFGLSTAAIHPSSARAASESFEAFTDVKPNGQFTWNGRSVPNYLALSALFSANSGRQPKPIVKIRQCHPACPTQIESVVKLATRYNFDAYVLIVQRVGNPVPWR